MSLSANAERDNRHPPADSAETPQSLTTARVAPTTILPAGTFSAGLRECHTRIFWPLPASPLISSVAIAAKN